ncbi:transposable element Tcb2 transposase [Trichonephila clavipes]|nr:transposable element Tcb2 transposase [Trichonephila clavipes]
MGLFEGCYAQCSDSTHLAELKTHIAQHILNLTPETLRSVVEQAASKFKLVAENGAVASEKECFVRFNTQGSLNGNCGTDGRGGYVKCAEENVRCGSLQCQRGSRTPLVPGMDKQYSRTIVYLGGSEYECKAVQKFDTSHSNKSRAAGFNIATDLHVQSVTMTGHIYREVILEPHVNLFRGTMGAEFLFMYDNARPHRANIVDECLQSEDITRMDWPAYSPDLNPIEHVWDLLGRRIAAPSTCLPELQRALLDKWCNIP